MNCLRLAAAAFAASLIFSLSPAYAASSDPRVAQLVAASAQALGVASLANISTIKFDENITAAGLKGTTVQWIDVRGGRFAEATNLPPVSSDDGYDGRVAW